MSNSNISMSATFLMSLALYLINNQNTLFNPRSRIKSTGLTKTHPCYGPATVGIAKMQHVIFPIGVYGRNSKSNLPSVDKPNSCIIQTSLVNRTVTDGNHRFSSFRILNAKEVPFAGLTIPTESSSEIITIILHKMMEGRIGNLLITVIVNLIKVFLRIVLTTFSNEGFILTVTLFVIIFKELALQFRRYAVNIGTLGIMHFLYLNLVLIDIVENILLRQDTLLIVAQPVG